MFRSLNLIGSRHSAGQTLSDSQALLQLFLVNFKPNFNFQVFILPVAGQILGIYKKKQELT